MGYWRTDKELKWRDKAVMAYTGVDPTKKYVYVGDDAKRVGHADRDRYVDHLSDMVSTGYLKQNEFDQRRDKALEATVKGELVELVADLPSLPPKAEPKRKMYRTQLAGYGVRFSWARWLFSTTFFASWFLIGAPILAHVGHGAMNGNGEALIYLALMFGGIMGTIVCGLCFSPDGTGKTEWK